MLGIFKDLPNNDYHADRTAVSRSGLWEFRKSPAHYWHAYLDPERPPQEDTPDLAFGRAFHTMVLEPHLFDEQYGIEPKKLLLKDVGRELYDNYKNECARLETCGKEIITAEQFETLQRMTESVMRHKDASRLITGGAIEHSLFWEDPHTGVRCKTRPDIMFDNMTVDLKTTADASERAFMSSLAIYGYHLQSAMNREGIYHTGGNDVKTHTFICVEKKFPYMVAVYILDQTSLDYAHKMFKNLLTKFKDCRDKNEWVGYPTLEISLPQWAKNYE